MEVCVALVSDLVEGGLDSQQSTLFVIDGGKALRKAITMVPAKGALAQEHAVLGSRYRKSEPISCW